MASPYSHDQALLDQLPFPLARVYGRVHTDKSAMAQHNNAFFLAEAALKLAASLRIGVALAGGLQPGSALAQSLEDLCRASVGQWVGFLRHAIQYLKARPGPAPLANTHDEMLRTTALPAVRAWAELASRPYQPGFEPSLNPNSARAVAGRGIMGFFDLVVEYRNRVLGHGAVYPSAYYEELGPALFEATCAVLRQRCLFGDLALALARVGEDRAGQRQVAWQGLRGPLAGLPLPEDVVGPEPAASPPAAPVQDSHVYFVGPGIRVSLHPLVVYQEQQRSEQPCVLFLNRAFWQDSADAGGTAAVVRRCLYQDYGTGGSLEEQRARRELTHLLSRLRGETVAEGELDRLMAAATPEDDERQPLPGIRRIGQYQVVRELGHGAMGVVYEAVQLPSKQRVAVKVLPRYLAADREPRYRFDREVRALGRCEHRNLVKFLTAGRAGSEPYYAMELVEGVNLAEVFRVLASWRGRLNEPLREGHLAAALDEATRLGQQRQQANADGEADDGEAPVAAGPAVAQGPQPEPSPPPALTDGRPLCFRLAELFADAADALALIHKEGIIHRDIQPGNLMLADKARRIVIVDLGLAKLREDLPLTQAGEPLVGTYPYCAPEQEEGAPDVGPRADVYSLGATLYELATLERLFGGDAGSRRSHGKKRGTPRRPRRVDPSLPPDLDTILMAGCLPRRPNRRCYASALQLRDDLRNFATSQPLQIRPPGLLKRALYWLNDHPVGAATAAAAPVLLLLTLLGGLVLTSWRWRVETAAHKQADDAWQAEATARAKADDARQAEAAARASAEETLSRNRVLLAGIAWASTTPNMAQAEYLLAKCPESAHTWEWHYLKRQCHAERLSIDAGQGSVYGVAYSPDGNRLASAGSDGTIRLWNADTGKLERTLAGHKGPVYAVAFSPKGGEYLASAGADGTVLVWDWAQGEHGEVVCTFGGHTNRVRSVAFSPVGRGKGEYLLASGGDDKAVKLWTFRRDRGKLTGPQEVPLKPKPTKDPPPKNPPPAECVRGVAFSHDGKLLASASGQDSDVPVFPDQSEQNGKIIFWDTASGEEVGEIGPTNGSIYGVAFSTARGAKGNYLLASAHFDSTVNLWDYDARGFWQAETPEAYSHYGHGDTVYAVAFSPDGKHLASGSRDETVQIGDEGGQDAILSGKEDLPEFRGHTDWVVAVAYRGPDGQEVASGGLDGTVKVWDVRQNPEAYAFLKHNVVVFATAFGPTSPQVAPGGKQPTASGDQKGNVWVWDAADREDAHRLGKENRPAHEGAVHGLAFSADGLLLASAGDDQAVRIWDAVRVWKPGTIKPTRTLPATGILYSVAFSPLAASHEVAAGGQNKTIWFWDASTGRQTRLPLTEHKEAVLSVAFHPDGARLASASGDPSFPEKPGAILVWDLKVGGRPRSLEPGQGAVYAVAFSPDGKYLASAGADKTVRIWDTTTWKELWTLRGHTGAVLSVAWNRDSRRLASGSADTYMRVWDTKAGEAVFVSSMNNNKIYALAFSPDGQLLAGANGYPDYTDKNKKKTAGRVRVWDARPLPELATNTAGPGASRRRAGK